MDAEIKILSVENPELSKVSFEPDVREIMSLPAEPQCSPYKFKVSVTMNPCKKKKKNQKNMRVK